MEFTVQQIADFLNGEIIGNKDISINNISKIENGEPHTLSFLANEKYVDYLHETKSSAILISKKLVPNVPTNPSLIVVEDAYYSFNQLLKFYEQFKIEIKKGIDKQCSIAENATYGENLYVGAFTVIAENVKIGNNVQIYPQCYIGKNVTIGDNVIIYPGVKIYHECIIGNYCIINSGSIIGTDGFGYIPSSNGYEKIPQLGNVILEDYVDIGANCTIDRATINSTIIKKGTKLDNLIQIAHNVEIGEHNVIASQTGIAGSTKIGNWNQIGGQVGIAGHIKIGNKVSVQGQSGVNKNTNDGSKLFGSPAMDATSYRKSYVYFKKLPYIIERLEKLEEIFKDKEK